MRDVLHRLSNADKACLLVPTLGAGVTVLEVAAPLLLWAPLHLVVSGHVSRAVALSPLPEPLRGWRPCIWTRCGPGTAPGCCTC